MKNIFDSNQADAEGRISVNKKNENGIIVILGFRSTNLRVE